MTRQEKAANIVVGKCLEIKRDESVLIVASEPLLGIADQLFQASSRKTKSTFLLQISHINPAQPIIGPLAKMMRETNVILAVTSPSISHTDAIRQAKRSGARIASLPGISLNTFCRIADANFEKLSRRSKKIADILSMAKEVHVTAPNGTDLTIPIKKRKGYSDTGVINYPGAFSNLPSGEASIAPEHGLCQGILVVDSGMSVNPNGEDRLTISIKNGRAQRIGGSPIARKLSQHLAKFSPDCRLVGEFGIGVNDAAQISGNELEDSKVLGTIHLGLGNNLSIGGSNAGPCHVDAVVYKASVTIDGRQIVRKGRLMLD